MISDQMICSEMRNFEYIPLRIHTDIILRSASGVPEDYPYLSAITQMLNKYTPGLVSRRHNARVKTGASNFFK